MTLHLFLDFDGTISLNDVGDELISTFGDFQTLMRQLLDGHLTVAEYYRRAAASFGATATPATVEAYARTQPLDPGFPPLVRWCREVGIPVTVVSDGFDVYITPMLGSIGMTDLVEVRCNRLSWHDNVWTPVFPGASEACRCFCASCKRNVILSEASPEAVVVYVGDGLSDGCAVRYADIVFAKDTLAESCTREGIPFHAYETLGEVLGVLQRRVASGDLRSRPEAVLARRRAVAAGAGEIVADDSSPV
jgi:2,3-diketo-5-methylthio-1-phosphopentane phosphatase